MPEFLMTFDMPNGTETFGRRNVTAGPTQSLALMNGHLAWKAADKWAHTLVANQQSSFIQNVSEMHLQAFGRPATKRETAWAKQLLIDIGGSEQDVGHHHWKEICHTMLNRKELIYVY